MLLYEIFAQNVLISLEWRLVSSSPDWNHWIR